MYSITAYNNGVSSKAGLSEKLSEATRESYTWLRDYVTAIKYGRLHPFTAVERKAREATRKDPWGPTGHQLAELADLSHHPERCQVIFAVLEFRLSRGPEKWRNVYKALLALEYLLVRGSPYAVNCAHSREVGVLLQQLTGFEAFGQGGIDHGQNVRIRAAAVLELLHDRNLLQQRREAAAARFGAISPMNSPQQQQQQQRDELPAFGGYSRQQMLQQQQQGGSSSSSRRNGYNINDQKFSTDWTATDHSAAAAAPRQQLLPAAAAAAGGFGEAKGVSFEENKLRIAELKKLLAQEGNRRCADCQDPTPAGRPTWASVNLGVFICMRCAGHHRGLGAHISKVRSCTLDTWLPEQVIFMSQTGNTAANAHFEAKISSSSSSSGFKRPARDAPEMAAFIRQKYSDQKWVESGTIWPPVLPAAAAAAVPQQPGAAAAAAGGNKRTQLVIQASQQQQQQQQSGLQSKVSIGFEDNAFSAAAAAAAAAGTASEPAAAAAVGPLVADLLCLDDSQGSSSSAAAAAAVGASEQQQQRVWDIMDAPMDIPGPTVSVLDWIEQRIATGADAAAQAAADAARQQRQQHRHQHAAVGVASSQRHQQQQQQQQYVFDPFVNGHQQPGVQNQAPTADAAQIQQQQQRQQQQQVSVFVNNPTSRAAAAAAAPTARGKVGGMLHSIGAGIQQIGSAAAAAAAGSSNVISTYEFDVFSSSEDESDDEQGYYDSSAPALPPAAAAATAAPVAPGQQQQHGDKAANDAVSSSIKSSSISSSSTSSSMPMIPMTPGFYTSTAAAAAAAAGHTGSQGAAAAAGFTGNQGASYPRAPQSQHYQMLHTGGIGRPAAAAAAAAAGFTGHRTHPAAGLTGHRTHPAAGFTGQRPQSAAAAAAGRVTGQWPSPAATGFSGSSSRAAAGSTGQRPLSSAGFTGSSSRAAAGFTGNGPNRVYYPRPPVAMPVGLSAYGGWGGYNVMAGSRTNAAVGTTGSSQQQQQQQQLE